MRCTKPMNVIKMPKNWAIHYSWITKSFRFLWNWDNFMIFFNENGTFSSRNRRFLSKCSHFIAFWVKENDSRKISRTFSHPYRKKENFLSLYISFFERNMHNNLLLCLYRTYLRYVLTKKTKSSLYKNKLCLFLCT